MRFGCSVFAGERAIARSWRTFGIPWGTDDDDDDNDGWVCLVGVGEWRTPFSSVAAEISKLPKTYRTHTHTVTDSPVGIDNYFIYIIPWIAFPEGIYPHTRKQAQMRGRAGHTLERKVCVRRIIV